MNSKRVKYLVVGSGAGGATLAKHLSSDGSSVLVIEQGKPEEKIGKFVDILRFYDGNRLTRIPKKSKEGVIIYRALMAGGTTMVAMANGVRSLQPELAALGINLEKQFLEAEAEMGIAPIPDFLISPGGERIRQAAAALGVTLSNMPKFIDPQLCKSCGNCALGCIKGAKWTALKYLDEAQNSGARVLYNTTVEKVILENGKAVGLSVKGPSGLARYFADCIIISAGGIGTPIILQKTGIQNAGSNLFIDILVNTYGVTDDFHIMNEPQMALVSLDFHDSSGFLLATFVNHPREIRMIEMGLPGYTLPLNRLVGIMTKISDEPSGQVYPDGSISKVVTSADQKKIDEGTRISTEILVKAGAKPSSIRLSAPQGAHPGGTAAVGQVVDHHLMTGIPNLYVCDASVLPRSPGLPPILTIVALGKYLSSHLQGIYN